MPSSNLEKYLLKDENRNNFSNKTYNDFVLELLRYASKNYKDVNTDFSDSSFGGMMLDFAAIVGDSLMFYAEQQFNELNYETAIDTDSINQHLRKAGIKNIDATPSSVEVTFEIEVNIDNSLTDTSKVNSYFPVEAMLPVLKSGNILLSRTDIPFVLIEDVDFSENYTSEIGETNDEGVPTTLYISKKGTCVSGLISSETVTFPIDDSSSFLSYKLENKNVSKIISVFDEDLNEYYNVEYLTQSTIFKKEKTIDGSYIKIVPAMRRFIVEKDALDNSTILRFGNGDGRNVKDNSFLNPEELFLPIDGNDYTNRIDIDPSTLLTSDQLGVSPSGKTLTITYRHMGGINHNVGANLIDKFLLDSSERVIIYKKDVADSITPAQKKIINDSMSVINKEPAVGGANALSIEELKLQIPRALKMQSRIITYEDLIARIMTMPSDFGRVHKAIALTNPNTNSSKDIFVICKDNKNNYVNASDGLKINLSNYLNEYRLVGDNFNILDVPIYNFGIKLKLSVQENEDLDSLLEIIVDNIIRGMRFDLLNIGEPINVNLMLQIVRSALKGKNIYVITPEREVIVSKTSKDNTFDPMFNTENKYHDNVFVPSKSFDNGMIYPPRGGIFELKFSSSDIEILFN